MTEGSPTAEVRVVSWESLQCSDCARYQQMLDEELLPRFGTQVQFVHRAFPLAKHGWSRPAAVAARFFEGQSAGWGLNFRRAVLAAIPEISAGTFPDFLHAHAGSLGIDPRDAIASLVDPHLNLQVDFDVSLGRRRDVIKTPTVLAGDETFIEVFRVTELSGAIGRMLAQD